MRTQITYESRAIAAIHNEYSLSIINCLVFTIKAGCVFREVCNLDGGRFSTTEILSYM